MKKSDVPLRVYSKWMWLALVTVLLSYIIVLSRIAEIDQIAAFFVFLSVSNAMIFGWRIGKEGTTYIKSQEAKE